MNSEVKVSYLSEEELTKVRIGAECNLEDRPGAKRGQDSWKWRSEKGIAAFKRKFERGI